MNDILGKRKEREREEIAEVEWKKEGGVNFKRGSCVSHSVYRTIKEDEF